MTPGTTVYRAGYPQAMKVKEVSPLWIKAEWTDDFGNKHVEPFDPKELRTRKPATKQ